MPVSSALLHRHNLPPITVIFSPAECNRQCYIVLDTATLRLSQIVPDGGTQWQIALLSARYCQIVQCNTVSAGTSSSRPCLCPGWCHRSPRRWPHTISTIHSCFVKQGQSRPGLLRIFIFFKRQILRLIVGIGYLGQPKDTYNYGFHSSSLRCVS